MTKWSNAKKRSPHECMHYGVMYSFNSCTSFTKNLTEALLLSFAKAELFR